jgi:hypothetical protein
MYGRGSNNKNAGDRLLHFSCTTIEKQQKRTSAMSYRILFLLLAWMSCGWLFAQTPDSTAQEEDLDFGEFDDFDFEEVDVKTYCSSKIIGISPQQLISLGYDFQGPIRPAFPQSEVLKMERMYPRKPIKSTPPTACAWLPIFRSIREIAWWFSSGPIYGICGTNLMNRMTRSTMRWPGRSARMACVQPGSIPPFSSPLMKPASPFSGKCRPEWRLYPQQFSVAGLPAVLRCGLVWMAEKRLLPMGGGYGPYLPGRRDELHPGVLLNWTSKNSPWGVEALLPARAHVRYSFSPRNMLFAGFELEGQSYRINGVSETLDNQSLEIRRGEMRWRVMWQRQLSGFIWLQAQAGYRYQLELSGRYPARRK